jgi:hypothetical protein
MVVVQERAGERAASGAAVERRARGFCVTERDRAIVEWLGRVRFATAVQLQLRFGLHRAKCYSRLKGLGDAGLVESRKLLHGQAQVYLATRAGLRFAGLASLPAATVSLQSFTHELAVTQQLAVIEAAGFATLTEREMRAAEKSGAEGYWIAMGERTSQGRERIHRPDFVIQRRSGLWAVEVELTAKTPERTQGILRAYRRTERYAGVVYYLPSQAALDRVSAMAAELGMGERFQGARIDAS